MKCDLSIASYEKIRSIFQCHGCPKRGPQTERGHVGTKHNSFKKKEHFVNQDFYFAPISCSTPEDGLTNISLLSPFHGSVLLFPPSGAPRPQVSVTVCNSSRSLSLHPHNTRVRCSRPLLTLTSVTHSHMPFTRR